MFHCMLLLAAAVLCAVSQDPDTHETFSASTMKFSVEILWTYLSGGRGNMLMSAVSMSTILAMLQQGARHTTEVLHVDAQHSRVDYRTFIHSLKENIGSAELNCASKGYANFGYSASQSYKNLMSAYFDAAIRKTDFSQREVLPYIVNRFAAKHTNNQIANIAFPDLFHTDTQLLLMNTLYLKDAWEAPFRSVQLHDFSVTYPQRVRVPVLRIQKQLRTGYLPHIFAQWLQMPLQSSRFYLLLLLPTHVYGQDDIIEGLTADDIFNIINIIETKETTLIVDVLIPKLRFQVDSNFTKVLNELGVPAVLDNKHANLCGISEHGTYVADVLQRAFLDINEDGVQFAAATLATENFMQFNSCRESHDSGLHSGVQNLIPSVIHGELQAARFHATHPFVVFVIDGENKVPLFSARVADPSLL